MRLGQPKLATPKPIVATVSDRAPVDVRELRLRPEVEKPLLDAGMPPEGSSLYNGPKRAADTPDNAACKFVMWAQAVGAVGSYTAGTVSALYWECAEVDGRSPSPSIASFAHSGMLVAFAGMPRRRIGAALFGSSMGRNDRGFPRRKLRWRRGLSPRRRICTRACCSVSSRSGTTPRQKSCGRWHTMRDGKGERASSAGLATRDGHPAIRPLGLGRDRIKPAGAPPIALAFLFARKLLAPMPLRGPDAGEGIDNEGRP